MTEQKKGWIACFIGVALLILVGAAGFILNGESPGKVGIVLIFLAMPVGGILLSGGSWLIIIARAQTHVKVEQINKGAA